MFSDNGGDRDNTRTWTIILATAAIAFAPLYTLKELAMQTQGTAAQSAGTALDMWQKLAFTLVLVSAFVLQVLLSRWWLSRHRQGPPETLWHKWTWMQFKRAA